MSNKHIEELLQQCIAAFDAGLSPEECLSAFPAARAELEPLFRQAISLRVAFAAAPRAEFRERTRERLLFAAGRDVSAAFAAQPDPEFVNNARQRFIRAAGAEAQEALRAVPPPRLPFWMNTRRRLLEAAAASRPQPVARPMGGIFALRAGLSMAVVVLAMAVAALAYTIGINDTPATNAQLAKLERDLAELQENPSSAKAQELTTQLTQLAEQPQVSEKLPELINRQKDVIKAAANEGLLTPALAQAQTQELAAAEAKAELRLAAARAEEPTSTPEPAATNTPAPSASRTPPVATTPVPAATPPPPGVALTTGQIRVGEVEDDERSIETANISFAVPAGWTLLGQIQLDEGDHGFGELDISQLHFKIQGDDRLLVDLDTGRITVILGGNQFALRTGSVRGELISRDDLQAKAGSLLGDLTLVRDSIELSGSLVPPPPTATPTNTATPASTATPTATPPAATSPAPSATP